MEAAYGIGVRNRYALFLESEDDSVDPYTATTNSLAAANVDSNESKKGSGSHSSKSQTSTNQQSSTSTAKSSQGPGHKSAANQQQQASNKSSSTLTESKQNVMANQKSDSGRQNRPRQGFQQRSGGGGGGERSGNRENQENRTQRSPRNNYETNNAEIGGSGPDFKNPKELRGDKSDNRRNGFQRNGPRGGRGGGGGDRGRFPKREFNRHSGSDRSSVKSTEKREGGGSHNWGKIDDFNEQTVENEELVNGGDKVGVSSDNEKPPGEEGATGEGDENATANVDGENAEQEPKNDEPQLKTLDEYKREMEEKRVHTQFNIRKPGEGEDKSKWKKTYVLKKKPVAEEEEVEYEEIEVEEDTNKRRNRQILDIEVNFRPAEGGRDMVRRGRGTGRGGSGAGGPRRERGDSERGPTGGANAGGNTPNSGERGERSNRGTGGPMRSGPQGGRGGGRGRDRRFQPAPKFDDLNDFPSLSS